MSATIAALQAKAEREQHTQAQSASSGSLQHNGALTAADSSSHTRPSQSQSWRTVEGGLATLASRYGSQNSASRANMARDAQMDDTDGDFRLSHGAPEETFDGSETEQSSMDKPIDSSNIGYRLLLRMGWKPGCGAGKHEQGRAEPVRLQENIGALGLGKQSEYEQMNNDAVKQRRALQSESIVRETASEREAREQAVEKQRKIESEVSTTLAVFRCADCDKQYNNALEYETHLSSYDHNHTVRLARLRREDAARKVADVQATRQKQQSKEDKFLEVGANGYSYALLRYSFDDAHSVHPCRRCIYPLCCTQAQMRAAHAAAAAASTAAVPFPTASDPSATTVTSDVAMTDATPSQSTPASAAATPAPAAQTIPAPITLSVASKPISLSMSSKPVSMSLGMKGKPGLLSKPKFSFSGS